MDEKLGEAMQAALDLVLAVQGKEWDLGDNLALVPCDDHLLKLISVAVAHGAAKFHRLAPHGQVRWGALVMIGGAQALNRAGDRPRTYATIGDILSVPDLAGVMNGPSRDAVEAGTEQYLGISIIRGRAGRRFLETMLANSGIDLALVEAAAARVSVSWSWPALAESDIETVNDFVRAHRRSFELRPGLRALVETDQGAFALADRLRELARFRRVVTERGLVQPTIGGTRELWKSAGVDPASFLGAPATDALIRSMLSLGSARSDEYSEPRFAWVVTERYRGLAFALPRHLRASSFPAEIDEVRALVVDRDGGAAGEAVRYVREGAAFRAPRLGVVPLISPRSTPPIQLVAQWDDADGRRELTYGTYRLPSSPVTVFAQDGEHVLRTHAGSTVHLVLAAGWRLAGPVPDFVRAVQAGLEAWRATVPNEPLTIELLGPENERLEWMFGGEAQLRLIARHGRRVAGLSLRGAPVFASWPEFEAVGMEGRVHVTVEEPGGMFETRALARNGRIRIAARRVPGLYTLQATHGKRHARVRFVFLPDARFSVEHANHDAVGSRGSRAVVEGVAAHLTPSDSDALSALGAIEFPAGVTGVREISVLLPDLGLTGEWSVSLQPATVRLLVDGERALPQPWDLQACSATSILELTGEPGAAVEFDVCRRKFEIVLSAEGRRRLRLCELPADLTEQEHGVISFRWAACRRQDVEFRNRRLERPVASIEGRIVKIAPKRALDGEVSAEILPVWKPWVEFERLPVRLVTDVAAPHYEFELPEQPGRYFVGLVERERPATGLCLAELDGEPPPLETALSRMLWERDTSADVLRKALTYEPWRVLEQIAARVNRYGRKFFNIADALRDVAARALAGMLVEGVPVEESALFRLLAQYDLDLLVLRYRDLERMAPSAGADEGRATELLDDLAGRGLGLVVAAVHAWPAQFEPARFGEIIASWAPIAGGAPVQLTPEDLALIRTPDDPELLPVRERASGSPRLQGLIQARKAERLLDEDPQLHDIAARFLNHQPPGAAYWHVAGTDPQRLPFATARFDALAYACARAVHAYRRDGIDINACRDARRIARHARALMDYWLNLLAAQDVKGARA